MRRLAFGSTPVVGSSNSRTFGSVNKAMPRLKRRLLPPMK